MKAQALKLSFCNSAEKSNTVERPSGLTSTHEFVKSIRMIFNSTCDSFKTALTKRSPDHYDWAVTITSWETVEKEHEGSVPTWKPKETIE